MLLDGALRATYVERHHAFVLLQGVRERRAKPVRQVLRGIPQRDLGGTRGPLIAYLKPIGLGWRSRVRERS